MAKHIHAENMALYAQDAMETPRPWGLWEWYVPAIKSWETMTSNPDWNTRTEYRRKPKMLSVTLPNGEVVSWPEPLKEALDTDEKYWYFNMSPEDINYSFWRDSDFDKGLLSMGMLHLTKEAAEQHYCATRKINTQGLKP